MTNPPKYIASLNIVGLPADFPWEGAGAHVGPMEAVTPLLKRVAGHTGLGQVSLCAGVLEWGAWRLDGLAPEAPCLGLVDAAFAYQIDPRYADGAAVGAVTKLPDQPPALSASLELIRFARHAIDPDQYWNSYYAPVSETFHSTHVVRHILPAPAKKAFAGWLEATIDRLQSVAAKPDEPFRKKKTFDSPAEYQAFIARHRGEALPKEILDPEFDYDHSRREELIEAFLAQLDWEANPFLRSPEQMKAMGFEGTPYRLR